MELGKIVNIEYEYTNLLEWDRPHREHIILDDKILEISKHHIYGESDIHIYKLKDTKLII